MEDIEGLKERILSKKNQHDKNEFQAGVGLSRSWDPEDAGEEVIVSALENLSKKPKFVLLFSTIHYAKERKGMKRFVNAAYDSLPEGTPLIGGTVAGFINNYGCFTRGATALAVYYPNMDVAIGIGRNTKRAPHLAAKQCAEMIKGRLKGSRYKNKFLFELVSGGKIPQFPGLGKRRVIKSGIISKIATTLAGISLIIFQRGVGREDEILDELVTQLKDFNIIGGSSMDDNNMLENYQFFANKTYTNALVALGIKTDLHITINTTYGLKTTNIRINITKKKGDERVIQEIDGIPAAEGFLNKMEWPNDFINERLYRKTFFIPFGYEINGILFPNVIGLFLGNDIVCGFKIEKDELYLLSATGKSLVKSVDDNLKKFEDKNNLLAIIISCAARLETLGSNVFHVKEKLSNFFRETPFLLIFAGGEDTYSPNSRQRHVNESFNIASFWIDSN